MILDDLRNKAILTNTEEELANYILSHPEEVGHMNINDLAEAAYVSTAAVSRLAKKVGCKNYNDFRVSLSREVEAAGNHVPDYNYPFRKGDSVKDISDRLYGTYVTGLKKVRETLDFKTLQRIVDEITQSGSVDIYGMGSTAAAAMSFCEKMEQIGHLTVVYDSVVKQITQARFCRPDTFAVILSYSGKTRNVINSTEILHERGIRSFLITANRHSEMVKYADYVYFIDSGEELEMSGKIGMFSSQAIISYYLNLIYALVFEKDYERNIELTRYFAEQQNRNFE